MDKEIFKRKLDQMGTMIRARNGLWDKDGYKDVILEPHPTKEVCGDCNKIVENRVVTFEVKWGYKEQPYWLKKCQICKEKIALKKAKDK